MYSPKIDEALIPQLYRLRRVKKIPMTRLVNQIIADALPNLENQEGLTPADANANDDSEARPVAEKRGFTRNHQRRAGSSDPGDRRSIDRDRGAGVGQDSDAGRQSSAHS